MGLLKAMKDWPKRNSQDIYCYQKSASKKLLRLLTALKDWAEINSWDVFALSDWPQGN
jgi:hypothetical protein